MERGAERVALREELSQRARRAQCWQVARKKTCEWCRRRSVSGPKDGSPSRSRQLNGREEGTQPQNHRLGTEKGRWGGGNCSGWGESALPVHSE